MISKLFFHIISGILGIFLASRFVPGIEFSGSTQILLIAGTILGLVNFFIKPILKIISLPLRILTLGLFSLVINMVLVWLVVDILFPNDLEIIGLIPLFWTTIIIWALNMIFIAHNPVVKS
ncbi:MAG: phage holin family protein [Candidatus Nealsonbacteria bacterium]